MIYLNGQPLDVTRFPDNTTQVWKLSPFILKETNYAHITWEFYQEGEFMELAQLKMLLESYGMEAGLVLKYLPYGRQDKKIANDATFALHTFAMLLNTLEFQEVIIMDPHSQVALDLIKNSRAEYPRKLVEQIAQEMGNGTIFCYPDKGAKVKYSEVYKDSYRPYVYGEKVRDQLTGHITSYELVGDVKDKNVLIVDDICDGGMTFKILAKDLLAAGAKEVNLFVTHGIFSKGLRTLKESGINKVFTKDGEVGEHQQQLTYRRL